MNLSDQVCSLELAKRLKELGVKQDSLFVYEYFNDTCYAPKFIPFAIAKPLPYGCKQYSAFNVAELGQLLPDFISTKDNEIGYIKTQKKDEEWKIYVHMVTKIIIYFDKNEANARAKMLIHLLENGLIENETNPKD
jgi:hypothetical protein